MLPMGVDVDMHDTPRLQCRDRRFEQRAHDKRAAGALLDKISRDRSDHIVDRVHVRMDESGEVADRAFVIHGEHEQQAVDLFQGVVGAPVGLALEVSVTVELPVLGQERLNHMLGVSKLDLLEGDHAPCAVKARRASSRYQSRMDVLTYNQSGPLSPALDRI